MADITGGDTDIPVVGATSLAGRIILSLALLSGLGSGTLTLVGTADRYRGADAIKDFALRDAQISHNKEQYRELKQQLDKIDDTHPPPELLKDIDDHEKRLRALER